MVECSALVVAVLPRSSVRFLCETTVFILYNNEDGVHWTPRGNLPGPVRMESGIPGTFTWIPGGQNLDWNDEIGWVTSQITVQVESTGMTRNPGGVQVD